MSEKHDRKRRIRREKRRERRQQRSLRKSLKSAFGWGISVLCAAILGYAFVTFGFQSVYMAGPSMEPSLVDGGRYMLNRLVYLVDSPERYDVVAFRSVKNQNEYYNIKRVIGLPGETVLIKDGCVYINGELLSDSRVDTYISTAGLAETELTLSDDEYFVLGDNPDSSVDSRYLDVGNVKENEITGRVKID